MSDYKVIVMPKDEHRFVIADKDGKVVNDAQGYGYTSKGAASKAMWYHFGGGKSKIDSSKQAALKFWRENKEAAKELKYLFDCYLKELAMDERSTQDVLDEVNDKFKIKIPKSYVKYLPY
jgi:hypothetical protein